MWSTEIALFAFDLASRCSTYYTSRDSAKQVTASLQCCPYQSKANRRNAGHVLQKGSARSSSRTQHRRYEWPSQAQSWQCYHVPVGRRLGAPTMLGLVVKRLDLRHGDMEKVVRSSHSSMLDVGHGNGCQHACGDLLAVEREPEERPERQSCQSQVFLPADRTMDHEIIHVSCRRWVGFVMPEMQERRWVTRRDGRSHEVVGATNQLIPVGERREMSRNESRSSLGSQSPWSVARPAVISHRRHKTSSDSKTPQVQQHSYRHWPELGGRSQARTVSPSGYRRAP